MNAGAGSDLIPESIPTRFEVASSAPVVRRALLYLCVVGTILIAINHGDAILRGDLDSVRVAKMMLTPVVPYVVSTLSSVAAIRANAEERLAERCGAGVRT